MWVYFHIDLVLQGITPVESFHKHAIEVFVLANETPLAFNLLPRRKNRTTGSDNDAAAPVPDVAA